MAPSDMVTVLEHCRVTPPPGTVVDKKSLSLTFLDLPWLHFSHVHHLLFYEFPYSKSHFMHTTIPSLKHSLSLTLKHFYPLAGNLMFPPDSGKPEILYLDGDSVSLTFAESSDDFNNLTGNHARNASDFHSLVPQILPKVLTSSNDTLVAPLLALKVTLFPKSGICVGYTFRHAMGDGTTFTHFLRSWASINKLGGDEALIANGSKSLPFYDRTVIKDPNGIETIFWSQVGKKKFQEPQPARNFATNKVRATFVMRQADVQNLKKWVSIQYPTLSHVSTFTVTCAYIWCCRVKARVTSGEEVVREDELEHFAFEADCRTLLDPPIPPTYMGNCLALCFASANTIQLIGEDGFPVAAEAIGKEIRERLHNQEGVLKSAEKWISDIEALKRERIFGVAGSPKFAYYGIDFGWGKTKKNEVVSIDVTGNMSLTDCRCVEGDLEVGLSFPKNMMEAFAAIFADGLLKVSNILSEGKCYHLVSRL